MGNKSSRHRPVQTNFEDIFTDGRNNLNACHDKCKDELKQCKEKNTNIDRQFQNLIANINHGDDIDDIISELTHFRQRHFSNIKNTTYHKSFLKIWRGGRQRTRRNRVIKR